MEQLGDRGGVYLNNLLGDAVSFSGDVAGLVQISREIRWHLDQYSRVLAGELKGSGQDDGQSLDSLHSLDAGSFIAFGASAMVVTFDDPVFGQVRVSIAEKINESARGTSRKQVVQSTLQAVLNETRANRGNPDIQLPFRVYVGQSTGLPIDPEMQSRIQRAILSGDRQTSQQLYENAISSHLDQLMSKGHRGVREGLVKTSALYNIGDAISAETLDIYRMATNAEISYVEMDLLVAELEKEIVQSFLFFEPELKLVVGFDTSGQLSEIFRNAGTVVFRGFEQDRPVEVWEMINLRDPIGRLLGRSSAILSKRI